MTRESLENDTGGQGRFPSPSLFRILFGPLPLSTSSQ